MSIFTQVPRPRIQRSSFDLSHTRKLSANLGQLVPVLCQEVVPGDKFNISTQSMVRFAPLTAPVMHRMNSTIHYFFVPNRLIMENWEEFITGQPDQIVPTIGYAGAKIGGLADHLGLPVNTITAAPPPVSILPFRAYFQIWNDYYRDVNLQGEVDIFDNIFSAGIANEDLKFRSWEKDYFTSALPTPQRGTGSNMAATINYKPTVVTGTNVPADINVQTFGGTTNARSLKVGTAPVQVENIQSVNVDVEELRRATKLQKFLERSMRAGNRYAEHLLAYWGVRSSDARLQRAEYLGGGRTPVVISDVANTTGTADAPQGNLSGQAMSVGSSNRATKYVEEHGYIMAIMSVLPETAYSQGIPRHFSRKLQLDYYFPDFAQLGEQPVLNQEIFLSDSAVSNKATFGYQSRYAEYKYAQNTVHGQFRDTLEFWHMARKFKTLPNLNGMFITANRINDDVSDPWRVFAVNTQAEQLWIQLYHQITAIRPMPFLNEPSI